MALKISDQAIESAIVAAATIAGAGATDDQVNGEFFRILTTLNPEGNLRKKLATFEDIKTIYGTLIGVDKEVTSGRGIVFLATKPHPVHNKEGKDLARSDFLASPGARALMNEAKGLVGHRVALTLAVVQTESNKAREILRLVDLGLDKDYNSEDAKYKPSYEKLDTSKLASHGAVAA